MNSKSGSVWLWVSGVLFLAFVANILVGKAALSPDFQAPFALSDVGEFLLLFAAIICFIAGVLRREAARDATPSHTASSETARRENI